MGFRLRRHKPASWLIWMDRPDDLLGQRDLCDAVGIQCLRVGKPAVMARNRNNDGTWSGWSALGSRLVGTVPSLQA
jgi:hypothetical protein